VQIHPRLYVVSSIAVTSFILFAPVRGASGAVIAANLPVNEDRFGGAIGYPSDAYLSDGQYGMLTTENHTFATRFTATQASRLTQLTFWGFGAGTGPLGGIQVQIWNSDLSAVVANQVWNLDQLAIESTGPNSFDQYAGVFDGSGIDLAAGDYWLNIGGIAVNPNDDTPWAWGWGQQQLPTAIAIGHIGSSAGWSPWYPFELYPNAPSYLLFGQEVPAPSALALLALQAMHGTRRRI
jgi:hypothetical protein